MQALFRASGRVNEHIEALRLQISGKRDVRQLAGCRAIERCPALLISGG